MRTRRVKTTHPNTNFLLSCFPILPQLTYPCHIPITALFESLLQDNWISSSLLFFPFFPLLSSSTMHPWAFLWDQFGVPVETSGWMSVLLFTLSPICWLDDPRQVTFLFRDSIYPPVKWGYSPILTALMKKIGGDCSYETLGSLLYCKRSVTMNYYH